VTVAVKPYATGHTLNDPGATALSLVLAEAALRLHRRNGTALSPELRSVVGAWAFAVPQVALRCPMVMAALSREQAAGIRHQAAKRQVTTSAQVRRSGVAAFDAGGSQLPESGPAVPLSDAASALLVTGPLTAGQAARMTGLTTHGVRTACRRGKLDARKNRVTGEWLIEPDTLRRWEAGKHAA
jgi:hypothetical protein